MPSEAEQVLDGIQLYVLLVGDYRVVYNIDQTGHIVNVSEVQRWPDA